MSADSFLTLHQYQVSALATIHHRKTFQHFRLKAVIVHGHKHKYLGGIWKTCQFNRTIAVCSPSRALDLPAMGCWPDLQY